MSLKSTKNRRRYRLSKNSTVQSVIFDRKSVRKWCLSSLSYCDNKIRSLSFTVKNATDRRRRRRNTHGCKSNWLTIIFSPRPDVKKVCWQCVYTAERLRVDVDTFPRFIWTPTRPQSIWSKLAQSRLSAGCARDISASEQVSRLLLKQVVKLPFHLRLFGVDAPENTPRGRKAAFIRDVLDVRFTKPWNRSLMLFQIFCNEQHCSSTNQSAYT